MAFNFHKGPQKIDDIISQVDANSDTKIDLGDNLINIDVSGSTLFSLKPKNAELTGSLIIAGPNAPGYALRITNGDLELADGIRLEAGSSGQFLMFNSGGNTQLQAVTGHMLFKVSSTRRYEFDLGGISNTDIFRVRDVSGSTKFTVDGTGNSYINGNLTITPNTGVNSLPLLISGSNTKGGASYIDFLQVTNTSSSIANPNKYFRLNGTGDLEIINSGYTTTILTLTNSGNMTLNGSLRMPSRPAFRVVGANNSPAADKSVGTVLSGSLVTVDYNQGSNYNNANGQFTCPQAGLYHVWYVGRSQNATGPNSVAIYKNDSTVLAFWENNNANIGHFGTSAVVNLAANDIITAKVTAGTITFDINDNWGVAYIG